jgi:branched-chain amino acid transport system substrate-binding protein
MMRLLKWALIAAAMSVISPSRAEVLIGDASPLTGPISWVGAQYLAGTELAVADLNATGGVLGEQVQLVSVDDACATEQAVAAARKLISDGVVFVVGHVCSGAAIAAAPLYEAASVTMMSASATNPRLTEEGRANVFRVVGRDDQQGIIAGDYLAEHWGDKRIAILHDGQPYGAGIAAESRKQLNKRGVSESCTSRSHRVRSTIPMWCPASRRPAQMSCTMAVMFPRQASSSARLGLATMACNWSRPTACRAKTSG